MPKLTWGGGTLLAPVPPTMVSCGTMENANIITVGWTGILCTKPPKTYVSIRPQRHSYKLIRESGEFIINLPTAEIVRSVDYCGIYTGAKVDKFAKCALTKDAAVSLSCPAIAECPVNLECRVTDIIPLGSHDMFIADIVNVTVSPTLVDREGKLHLDRAALLAYAHSEYFTLGKKLGKMGMSTKKKTKNK